MHHASFLPTWCLMHAVLACALLMLLAPQESKNGLALLRKVKVLTEENEDLGRQQHESKAAAQVSRADTRGSAQCGSQLMCLLLRAWPSRP
jgi:hypothetical protein